VVGNLGMVAWARIRGGEVDRGVLRGDLSEAGASGVGMSDRSRDEILRENARLPIVALPLDEAAAALGMSLKSFNRYVRPHVGLIRRNGLSLVPVRELGRWADRNAVGVFEAAS
jgi:hypothetical protein